MNSLLHIVLACLLAVPPVVLVKSAPEPCDMGMVHDNHDQPPPCPGCDDSCDSASCAVLCGFAGGSAMLVLPPRLTGPQLARLAAETRLLPLIPSGDLEPGLRPPIAASG